MTGRALTPGERGLAAAIFGAAIDYDAVRVHARRWWPFQPRDVAMSPDGDLWFHPGGCLYRDDFSAGHMSDKGLFLHEMTHVWQAQRSGRWWLPFMRHPFCRYRYTLTPGRPFAAYGIEQQAEIVRHAWMLAQGLPIAGLAGGGLAGAGLPGERQPDRGKPDLAAYRAILPFGPAS